MKIKIKGTSARECLDIVTKLTSVDHASIEIEDKSIFIMAHGNSRSIKINIEGEVLEKPKQGEDNGFGFNVYTFSNIVKGRDWVEFYLKDSQLKFRSLSKRGKFYGDFQTVSFDQVQILTDEVEPIKLNSKQLTSLEYIVGNVSISNVMTSDPMNLFIKIDKFGIKSVVYDTYCVAYCEDSSITSKNTIEFSIPLPLFQTINQIAQKQDYELYVGDAYITAKSVSFEVSLPLLQSIEGQEFSQAYDLAQTARAKKSDDQFMLNVEQMQNTISSLNSVADGSSGIRFENKKNKLIMTLESTFGKAVEKVKTNNKDWSESYNVSPSLLDNLLSVYPGDTLEVKFVDPMLVLTYTEDTVSCIYLCALM